MSLWAVARDAWGTVDTGAMTLEPTGFWVADDGPGIPDADRESVLEEGFTTASSGTGCGLAIVREIAEGHGWSVGVEESDAGGARFVFGGVVTPAQATAAAVERG